jgi:hypothetical protein
VTAPFRVVDEPSTQVPARTPGSARRTSHVDAIWLPIPGLTAGPATRLVLRAAARDVVTDGVGAGRVVADGALEAWIGADAAVEHIEIEPEDAGVRDLVGRRAGSGFRAAARLAVPGAEGEPVGLLLDDVPVAVLVGNYASLRTGHGPVDAHAVALKRDICSGWRDGGTMMAAIDRGDPMPLPNVVPAPRLDALDGPVGVEPLPALPPGSLRRRRRIDVRAGDPAVLDAMFRDTFAEDDGSESVLHEYSVHATVDRSGRLLQIEAVPRVLPHIECPAATASVPDLVGERTADLGMRVGSTLGGIRGCTHLNDLLRSLSCVPRLLALRAPYLSHAQEN